MIFGSASASTGCAVCGAAGCGCGPATSTVQFTKEAPMPVQPYDVVVGGIRTRLKLTEQEARSRGIVPAVKKRTAANKARPAPAAPERPAGNASTADWAAYAKAVGVDVPDDAGRSDIIAAVDAA